MMVLTCFIVTFLEMGFAFGGYTDDALVFGVYWVLHLIGGLGFYTQCTITIPMAIWSADGDACGALDFVNFERLKGVFYVHAGKILFRRLCCLCIFFFDTISQPYTFRLLRPLRRWHACHHLVLVSETDILLEETPVAWVGEN